MGSPQIAHGSGIPRYTSAPRMNARPDEAQSAVNSSDVPPIETRGILRRLSHISEPITYPTRKAMVVGRHDVERAIDGADDQPGAIRCPEGRREVPVDDLEDTRGEAEQFIAPDRRAALAQGVHPGGERAAALHRSASPVGPQGLGAGQVEDVAQAECQGPAVAVGPSVVDGQGNPL